MATPILDLFTNHYPESYWPDEYVDATMPLLEQAGWIARSPELVDLDAVEAVLVALHDTGYDETDLYPFGIVWTLRAAGAIGDIPGLDDELRAWRAWEELDHIGLPLNFLPPLTPDGDRLTRYVTRVIRLDDGTPHEGHTVSSAPLTYTEARRQALYHMRTHAPRAVEVVDANGAVICGWVRVGHRWDSV